MAIRTLGRSSAPIAVGATLFATVFASASHADTIIYNGGAPDQLHQIDAEYPGAVAMSFTLQPGTNLLSGVNWWGGCGPATTCGGSSDFVIAILDSGGNAIAAADVGTANQTATGNTIGGSWAEYAYSLTFPAVTLPAGVPLWFAITEVAAEPNSGVWGIETTSSAPGGQMAASIGVTSADWTLLHDEQLAFNLIGPVVPESSTWAMMIAGFVGLGWMGYARRRAVRAAAA